MTCIPPDSAFVVFESVSSSVMWRNNHSAVLRAVVRLQCVMYEVLGIVASMWYVVSSKG